MNLQSSLIKKRNKVFEYLDDQILMQMFCDFSMMPEEVRDPLFTAFPDYPTYQQYKQVVKNKNFITFDAFTKDIIDYIDTIPKLFPFQNFPNNEPPMNIKVCVCACQEIQRNLNMYTKLLKLDKNVLKGKYFKYVTDEYESVILQRPDSTDCEILTAKNRARIFDSHGIPLKVNPT